MIKDNIMRTRVEMSDLCACASNHKNSAKRERVGEKTTKWGYFAGWSAGSLPQAQPNVHLLCGGWLVGGVVWCEHKSEHSAVPTVRVME